MAPQGPVMQNQSLVLDLLEWLAVEARPYAEVMEAWRTSCPLLPIWEDAVDAGFVAREHDGSRTIVALTPGGRAFLASARPGVSAP